MSTKGFRANKSLVNFSYLRNLAIGNPPLDRVTCAGKQIRLAK